MTLRLEDKWVWDFWLLRHGAEHHIFYLQAPRALGLPALRHHNASIGHAVSSDLTHWRILPDAIRPGPPGSWDDLAVWTGSAIEHEGRWYMLYTGVSRAEEGLIQRVGVAVSSDLIDWHKHEHNPVLEADPRWYELLDLSRWRDQSWRDPWLFRHDDEYVHALITARSPSGPVDGAGVLAHARSLNLLDWEVLPPVTSPGEFAQLEVPQLVRVNGRYALLFCCHAEDHSRGRVARLGTPGQGGTFVLSADKPLGPYSAATHPLLAPGVPLRVLYAGKLVEAIPGDWRLMAFGGDGDRDFVGEITDPMPVREDSNGCVVIANARDSRPARRVALAREIETLISWGTAVAQRHRGLEVGELRTQLRDEHDRLTRQIGLAVEPVAATTDHGVSVAGGEILVRVFTPEGAGPHPALVHLHGGGFVFGTIDSLVNNAKCTHICRHAQCVVATVEYRLAPEHPFPTATEDCYSALRFIAERAGQLGIDAARIAVGGESAGGNLAAVTALMSRDRDGPPLAFQLLEVPVTDMSQAAAAHPSVALFGEGYGLDRSEIDGFTAHYLGDHARSAEPYASPLLAADLSRLPPACVMTAEHDPLRDSGEAYGRRLEQAGVEVTRHRMLGHTHGSSVLWPVWEPAAEWMRAVVAALRRALHEQDAAA